MASKIPPPKRKRVAYGMAKKADPGGRLSNQDVTRQLHKLNRKRKNRLKKGVSNPDPTWSSVH
jgi:hypothetical protein